MKAMIFAAGLGTRLAPLTDTCPKALIEIGGVPMLRHVISCIEKAGITDITVNVHHHARMIMDYLADNDFGVTVHISDESDRLLDTGGGVAKASEFLLDDEPVLLYNADIYTDFPLKEMMDCHFKSCADVTLLTSGRSSSRYLLFDRNRHMTGWENVKTGEIKTPYTEEIAEESVRRAFGGIHIISQKTLGMITLYKPGEKFSITPFYIDNCDRLDIRSYTPSTDYTWVDIGRPETLALARKMAEK